MCEKQADLSFSHPQIDFLIPLMCVFSSNKSCSWKMKIRNFSDCMPFLCSLVAALPKKISCSVPAAYSGVGTLSKL